MMIEHGHQRGVAIDEPLQQMKKRWYIMFNT
jgi:hypothetical protein